MSHSTRRQLLQSAASAAMSIPFVHFETQAADPRQRIRVAQIGVAHAHATKLSVYRNSPDYDVIGIAEEDETFRSAAVQQAAFRDLKWMTRQQILEDESIDVILVETAVSDLLDTAEACIAANKHIHLDKPAGESLRQFRRILAAAERQQRLVQMGYMYRYNPGVILLRQFLRDGWLGDIFEVHTVMSKVVDATNRRAFADYPGGILFELGCHVLDLVIHLLGKPVRVTPHFQHASTTYADTLRDNMLAVLDYDRAIATVKSTAMEVEGFARRHLVVCGSRGTFHIQPLDDPRVTLSLDQARGDFKQGLQEIALPKYSRYVGDAVDMARVLRKEKESDFSYAHDLTVQETLLQACGVASEPVQSAHEKSSGTR